MSPNKYDVSPKRLSVRIDPELKLKLQSRADEYGISLSKLVNKTLERLILCRT